MKETEYFVNNIKHGTLSYPKDLKLLFESGDLSEMRETLKNKYSNYTESDSYTNSAFTANKTFDCYDDYLYPLIVENHIENLVIDEISDNNPIRFSFPFVTKIVIGYGVTKLYDFMFYEAPALEEVIISDSVAEIGDEVFYKCRKLKKLLIPGSVTKIGTNICGNSILLESIDVDSVNKKYCSLDSNIIMEKESGRVVCGCKNSKIPQEVKTIGFRSFYQQSLLKNFVVPENVTVEEEAFYGTIYSR